MTEKLHYIEFRHVYKTFDHPVLVDANFYVNPGETVAIIGRSGVGKSVSLGHIMGFLKPDKGRVIVAITFQSDVGDSWEWADAPQYPQKYAALGIRIGVNYIVYAMTH